MANNIINKMPSDNRKKRLMIISLALLVFVVGSYYIFSVTYGEIEYKNTGIEERTEVNDAKESNLKEAVIDTSILSPNSSPIAVTHISTPSEVKAIYTSSWVAGSAKYRDPLIRLIDSTELNSIVIDIKDSTGRIGYQVADPMLAKFGSAENRISNIRALTNLLHQKNIYVIGRISVFQDPYMTKLKPEWSITKKSDGTLWKDRKGLSFLDPANKEVWNYVVAIAKDAYDEGFDEINFDYIRYPSDGNIKDINYRLANGDTRADNIEKFFIYLNSEMTKDVNIPISADLFGLTTEAGDDMGIGQVWEKALPHFDFLAPMVYPSHYPSGHDGYKNPASYPYEIIHGALLGAINKTKAMPNENINKIRPWLQDFNLGATYTKEMMQKQMKAVYDSGLKSWMIWDPNNKYTSSFLALETKP